MRSELDPHEPGCLGNHLGDCAVSGLFDVEALREFVRRGRDAQAAVNEIIEQAYFHGHTPRECGEHRTVGAHRAWCFDCTEWCYPRIDMACKGCEIVHLRKRLESGETPA